MTMGVSLLSLPFVLVATLVTTPATVLVNDAVKPGRFKKGTRPEYAPVVKGGRRVVAVLEDVTVGFVLGAVVGLVILEESD